MPWWCWLCLVLGVIDSVCIRRLRFAVCNPCSLVRSGRSSEFSTACSQIDIIATPGTLVHRPETPDRHFHLFVNIVKPVALKYYGLHNEKRMQLLRDLRHLREAYMFTLPGEPVTLHMLEIRAEIKAAQALLRYFNVAEFNNRLCSLDMQIAEAWRSRNVSLVLRLARQRSCKRIGVWKRDYRALPSSLPWAYGGGRKRRREELMICSRVTSWRACKQNFCLATKSYDMRKAFYCGDHQQLADLTVVQAQAFNTFHIAKPLFARAPFARTAHNDCLGLFSDDIFRHIACSTDLLLCQLVQVDLEELDEAVVGRGYSQNTDKADVCLRLRHRSLIHSIVQHAPFQGRILPELRHLGDLYAPNGNNKPEVAARVRACAAAWMQLGSFWFSRAGYSSKRLLFAAVVMGVKLTGLESYDVSLAEFRRLDFALDVVRITTLLVWPHGQCRRQSRRQSWWQSSRRRGSERHCP